ncbi:hypothetical protein ACJMK2_035781 [Sinanodonta woodiana]|uniref:Echinoderm microtubule-associated protein-like 2 n=1 Tax=Sinanodonta woodiana TaxID=1069815 RepID=A0ABD3WF60_SINWO
MSCFPHTFRQTDLPAAGGMDDVLDGLLSEDNRELSARVAALETKVQKQEDEIVCIKSALADVLRRQSQAEHERAQNSILPSKPHMRTPRKMSGSDRKSHLSALENVNVVPYHASPSPRHPPTSRTSVSSSIKKWGSVSNSIETNGHNTSQLSHANVKEAQWNEEDGFLKIYMKGRPIQLWAPQSVTNFNASKPQDPPNEKLLLDWVYGYRGRDCRSNLYMLPTGECVYFAAAVVVLHNLEEGTQRHYLGHTDDIKCLAIHPDQVRVASGQVAGHDKKEGKKRVGKSEPPPADGAKMPHVRVWDSVSLQTLHVLGVGEFDRAISCVSFSKVDGGNHLLVVDESNDHVMSVWNLSRDKYHKIGESKTSGDPVTSAEFHPSEKNSIVCCGKGQISFWTYEGGTMNKRTGIFDKYEKPKIIICIAFTESGDVLSGDSSGSIFVWGKGTNKITHAIKDAHDGGVFSLCKTKDGTILSGGGKDRKIKQWDSNYKQVTEKEIPEQYGPVRMLSQGQGNLILVGTIRNCILQGTLDLELNCVVEGHKEELWGLATHPSQHQFLSCGSDHFIYMWDSQSHSVVWSKEVADPAHCASIHPNGDVAAVGLSTGRWLVLDLSSREVLTVHTDGSEQHECIAYSPDGNYLAIGSRDNFIYVFNVAENGHKYSKVGKCSGHSSFVTHIDWSTDSQYIVSNSGDYEVLCWLASNCKQFTNKDTIREIQWATQNCTLAFNTAGIWPDGADGTDVNNCARSHKGNLIASADDFGKVNLFSYPCCQPKSHGHSYGGHSSHVTNAAFLFDDSRLITCGGRDMAVLQWEVV